MSELLQSEYTNIIRSYLEKKDEASLQLAYEFGRKAITSKMGLLEVIDIYNEAILTIFQENKYLDVDRLIPLTTEVLETSLASFEIIARGYEETVSKLKLINQDLKNKAESLHQANNDLDSFNYSVSHDLRAPLRRILSFSQIIMRHDEIISNNDVMELLHFIIDSAKKMNSVIESLLNMARLSKIVVNKQTINLSQIAKDIFGDLQSLNSNRIVNIKIAENLIVNADPELMRAALTNLLSNAWKFTAKRSNAKIEFDYINENGNSRFYIKDNGVGFDMKYINKLFSVFQRLHAQEEYEGTGVGLSIVQRVIQQHGGSIWAEAEENKGATFYFTLP